MSENYQILEVYETMYSSLLTIHGRDKNHYLVSTKDLRGTGLSTVFVLRNRNAGSSHLVQNLIEFYELLGEAESRVGVLVEQHSTILTQLFVTTTNF